MPLSVRKSISHAPIAAALSLTIALTLCSLALVAQTGQKQPLPQNGQKQALPQNAQKQALPQNVQNQETTQVKKLDDNNKEVLRPIPAVLNINSESTKPLEKQKTGVAASTLTPASNKGNSKGKPSAPATGKDKGKPSAPATDKDKGKPSAPATDKDKGKPSASPTSVPDKGAVAKPGSEKKANHLLPEKKSGSKAKAVARGAHFVPPPPPSTPTMMGDSSDFAFYGGVPVEMLSKDALKDRCKEISIQYKDACRELEDRNHQKVDKIQRAQEFEGLYKEGVVSRRELEASQKEAGEINADIDRLSSKVNELKGLLDRINRRLLQPVAKKRGHKLIN